MTKGKLPPPIVVPASTRPLDESQAAPSHDAPDIVTALRVWGQPDELPLPPSKSLFSLGSAPDRDLRITNDAVSGMHCILERRGATLRVRDQESRNGTIFNGRKEESFELHPGETFLVATTKIVALNDEMRAHYALLRDLLGTGDVDIEGRAPELRTPSETIVLATSASHLVITGEPDCDQERLARAIHAVSLRRHKPIVEISKLPDNREEQRTLLERASRSTLVITLEPKSPLADPIFVSTMFSTAFHIRVIVLAPTIAKASDAIGASWVRTLDPIAVLPLAKRPEAILPSLDRLLAEAGSPLRTGQLTTKNRATLRNAPWQDNVKDLKIAATRMAALAGASSMRKAAEVVGVSVSTLHYWVNQLGLDLPLVGP